MNDEQKKTLEELKTAWTAAGMKMPEDVAEDDAKATIWFEAATALAVKRFGVTDPEVVAAFRSWAARATEGVRKAKAPNVLPWPPE